VFCVLAYSAVQRKAVQRDQTSMFMYSSIELIICFTSGNMFIRSCVNNYNVRYIVSIIGVIMHTYLMKAFY